MDLQVGQGSQTRTRRAAPGFAEESVNAWGDLRALYQRHFGAWATSRFAARAAWQFNNGDSSTWLVAREAGAAIGMMTAFPLIMRLPEGTTRVLAVGDLAVDPGHPLLPLQLSKAMANKAPLLSAGATPDAARIGKYIGDVPVQLSKHTFSYPLRNRGGAMRAMRRKLPSWLWWAVLPWSSALTARYRPPQQSAENRSVPARPMPHLERMHGFTGEYAELWELFSERHCFGVDKTCRYMNWRYVDTPARSIKVHAIRSDDRLDGVLVTGVATELDHTLAPCGTVGEILELIVRDPRDQEFVAGAVAAAMNILNRARVDRVRATGLSILYHKPLADLGFEPDANARHQLAMNATAKCAADLGRTDRWYLSAGDGDQLFTALL